jgi:hypothetical protein
MSGVLRCRYCGRRLKGKQQQWCSPGHASMGWQRANTKRASEHTARWRAKKRRTAAGLPPVLSPLEQRLVDLEVERALLKGASL